MGPRNQRRSSEYDYQGIVYVHGVSDGELDDLFDDGSFVEDLSGLSGLTIAVPIEHNFLAGHQDLTNTYDHRSVRTGHPVRSAIHKH